MGDGIFDSADILDDDDDRISDAERDEALLRSHMPLRGVSGVAVTAVDLQIRITEAAGYLEAGIMGARCHTLNRSQILRQMEEALRALAAA